MYSLSAEVGSTLAGPEVPDLYEIVRLVSVLKIPPLVPVLSQLNLFYSLTRLYIYKIHFNIILTSTLRFSEQNVKEFFISPRVQDSTFGALWFINPGMRCSQENVAL